MSLIYIQHPPQDPLVIIRKRLKEEEHFEEVIQMKSFRAVLLRSLLEEIEQAKQKDNQ